MRIDPFLVKRFPKWHYKRLSFTLYARAQDALARLYFDEYELPKRILDSLPPCPDAQWSETQVEPEQARYLLYALNETEEIGGCVVEVGAWRGETTKWLAENTKRPVVAVDPWIGTEGNFVSFEQRTKNLANVSAERKTFGQVIRNWRHGPVSFAFIDAVHDYVNVSHDYEALSLFIEPGGIIAFHDTDNVAFGGCRRAVYERAYGLSLFAHIPNLTMFKVPG